MNLIEHWNAWWQATANEREEYNLSDTSNWRMAAMKSRNPEDGDWWYANGYKFLENWVQWREENTHMSIAKLDDGTLAIELEMAPVVNGVTVKMAIDRVFYDSFNKEYVIVDLKTGKTTPHSSLQLAFYAYGIRKQFGLNITKGYYWMARKGELSPPHDLAGLDDSKVETLVDMFDKARKSGIFLPNFDHCIMCGYTAQCQWYTPKEKHE